MVLRSKDSATAQAWFSAIHANVSDLVSRVIAEVREQLGKTGIAGSREIRHLGWLAEKVRKMVPSMVCPDSSMLVTTCLISQSEYLSCSLLRFLLRSNRLHVLLHYIENLS